MVPGKSCNNANLKSDRLTTVSAGCYVRSSAAVAAAASAAAISAERTSADAHIDSCGCSGRNDSCRPRIVSERAAANTLIAAERRAADARIADVVAGISTSHSHVCTPHCNHAPAPMGSVWAAANTGNNLAVIVALTFGRSTEEADSNGDTALVAASCHDTLMSARPSFEQVPMQLQRIR